MAIELGTEIEENYRALKVERGHTWAELAEQFAKEPDEGSQTIALWCLEQEEDEADKPKPKPARQTKAEKAAAEKAAAEEAEIYAFASLPDEDRAALLELGPEGIQSLKDLAPHDLAALAALEGE
jgi:hypothetical protein